MTQDDFMKIFLYQYIIMDIEFNYTNAILSSIEYIVLNLPIAFICAFFALCGMMGGDAGVNKTNFYLYISSF